MFDIGWSEMAVIALVALLVVGPKQLPQAMRTFASFSKKMRRYAQDFRSGVDNIIREAELEDAKKALDGVRKANPRKALQDWVDPTGEMTDEINSVEREAKDKGAKDTGAKDTGTKDTGTGAKTGGAATAPKAVENKTVEKKALPAAGAAAASAGADSSAEPAAAGDSEKRGARKVSQPLQMAPPHSIRPPQEAAKEKATVPATPTPATPGVPSPPNEVAEAKPAGEGKPHDKSGGSGTA